MNGVLGQVICAHIGTSGQFSPLHQGPHPYLYMIYNLYFWKLVPNQMKATKIGELFVEGDHLSE